jgi:hypothetical protein
VVGEEARFSISLETHTYWGVSKSKRRAFFSKKKSLLSFLWGFFFDKKEGPRRRASFFTKPFFLDMDEICHE